MIDFFETLRAMKHYGWENVVDDECVMLGDHILCFADKQLVGYYESLFRRADNVIIKKDSITVMCMGDCIARITKQRIPCAFA